jgi:hypothetical protein
VIYRIALNQQRALGRRIQITASSFWRGLEHDRKGARDVVERIHDE